MSVLNRRPRTARLDAEQTVQPGRWVLSRYIDNYHTCQNGVKCHSPVPQNTNTTEVRAMKIHPLFETLPVLSLLQDRKDRKGTFVLSLYTGGLNCSPVPLFQ